MAAAYTRECRSAAASKSSLPWPQRLTSLPTPAASPPCRTKSTGSHRMTAEKASMGPAVTQEEVSIFSAIGARLADLSRARLRWRMNYSMRSGSRCCRFRSKSGSPSRRRKRGRILLRGSHRIWEKRERLVMSLLTWVRAQSKSRLRRRNPNQLILSFIERPLQHWWSMQRRNS